MRQDVEDLLRGCGWVFAGVSQPEHKRQWALISTDADGKDTVTKVEDEDYLVDLALNIIDYD